MNERKASKDKNPYKQILADILSLEGNEFVDRIRKCAEKLKKVSMHQLRSIYSKIMTINKPEELALMRYRLAYAGARQKELRDFCEALEEVIQSIKTESNVEKFKQLFEGIIAYHKYFNPRG